MMSLFLRTCSTGASALLALAACAAGPALSEKEAKRQALNDRFDTRNLRRMREFVVDRSEEFLRAPKAAIAGAFEVARTPPTVRFQVLPQLEPEHFADGVAYYQAGWANWAYVCAGPDNRFFMAASDHRGRGAQLNLYEYRRGENRVTRVLDVSRALGWHADMYTDGKIHGHMGVMPDGELWVGTHFGPHPDEAWFAAGYRGSWLLSYNIHTGEARNWGTPLLGHDLACHTLDAERGIFLATGSARGMMLSWDAKEKQVRFAGHPPNGWVWAPRAMLLDKTTGIFWGHDAGETPYRFMAFDPARNRFKRFEVEVPGHPETGHQAILRGHTADPDAAGWYYWATLNGTFFRFRPDWETGPAIEPLGVVWDKGRDVLQMAIDPHRRYVYYQPKGYPAPLVQYDVKTGRKKAVAFLQDYYFEKYGYWPCEQVYGLEIANDGSFIVLVDNGTFEGRGRSFGHPAVMVVEIPESERALPE